MLEPITKIAHDFNDIWQSLSAFLKSPDLNRQRDKIEERQSKVIDDFMNALKYLPAQISKNEHRDTVLFEIDRTLLGIYGSQIFSDAENTYSNTKLFKDIAALWQMWILLPESVPRGNEYLYTNNVTSFYDLWSKSQDNANRGYEKDLIINDISLLFNGKLPFDNEIKVKLFSTLANIFINLSAGKAELPAREFLSRYSDQIKDRSIDINSLIFSELLLSLHIARNKVNFKWPSEAFRSNLDRAVRYWSGCDDFIYFLFKSWSWYKEKDYYTPLLEGAEEEMGLRKTYQLYRLFKENETHLDIGHSYIERFEHEKTNTGKDEFFRPIPIFLFGKSGVGKSCFLSAFYYENLEKGGVPITPGPDFEVYWRKQREKWHSGSISPTTELSEYHFGKEIHDLSFTVYDYPGKSTEPEHWDATFKELFIKSRGLFFFIEAEELANPKGLKETSAYFNSIISHWMKNNPNINHIPVSLVISKCDKIFGDIISKTNQARLVPYDFQPVLIDGSVASRSGDPTDSNIFKTRYERFKDMLLYNRKNNSNIQLQDLVEILTDNLSHFFDKILSLTYYYQIFITCARAPQNSEDKNYPTGTKDAIGWAIDILEKFHIHESIKKANTDKVKIKEEIGNLENEIKIMKDFYKSINKNKNEIDKLNGLGILSHVFKNVIKRYQDEKLKCEQEIEKIFNKYLKNGVDLNSEARISRMEDMLKQKNELKSTIDDKIKQYNAKLKIIQG